MQMFRRKGKPVADCTPEELRFAELAMEIDQDARGAEHVKKILEEGRATHEELHKVLALIRYEAGQHEPPSDAQLSAIVASLDAAKALDSLLKERKK